MAQPADNLLANETSPYLLQHADNPVHWRPWDEAALAEARERNVPILLSIGYSACHWCHVMAHESFEDEASAGVMNELFINIKVDREERPDLDRIYQMAHYALTQRNGGWPLTMFLDPRDLQPFFGGTYFPKQPRHGLPAFTDLLRRVADYYRERGLEVAAQGRSMAGFFASLSQQRQADVALDAGVLAAADRQLLDHFEPKHGGFSGAPKFPHPTNIAHCLRRGSTAEDEASKAALRHAAAFSLTRMAEGGLYDHLGGGFCRYSVDEQWMIPHFEKMLYDNALLLPLYADWHAATGSTLAKARVEETIGWLLREMRDSGGGFHSALDADSEGEEGLFYLWTPDEVQALLDGEELALFARRYGLDRAANFEGRWHLHAYLNEAQLAQEFGLGEEDISARLASVRETLFAAREPRVRPGCDDKVLTAWNGLLIHALAVCGQRFGRSDWLDAATEALDFIRRELWREGRLLASYRAGHARHPAYLDDYAFLLQGTLALLSARWDDGQLAFATELADALLAHFENTESGGFFFTADDHEQLIHRPLHFSDEALPSGNGVAAQALLQLGWLLGETRYLDAAERTLDRAAGEVARLPGGHGSLLQALQEKLNPPSMLILRGDADSLTEWRTAADQQYSPELALFAIPNDADLPPALASKHAGDSPRAYLCQGMQCEPPLTDRQAFDALVAARRVEWGEYSA